MVCRRNVYTFCAISSENSNFFYLSDRLLPEERVDLLSCLTAAGHSAYHEGGTVGTVATGVVSSGCHSRAPGGSPQVLSALIIFVEVVLFIPLIDSASAGRRIGLAGYDHSAGTNHVPHFGVFHPYCGGYIHFFHIVRFPVSLFDNDFASADDVDAALGGLAGHAASIEHVAGTAGCCVSTD